MSSFCGYVGLMWSLFLIGHVRYALSKLHNIMLMATKVDVVSRSYVMLT